MMELSMLHQLVKKHYGLVVTIKKLVSYEDQNFLLSTVEGNRYVLKLSAPISTIGFIKAQNEALELLARQNATLYPILIPTKKGLTFFPIKGYKEVAHGRLLTYLEGTFLAEVKHTTALFFNFGRALAKLDKILSPFRNPVLEARQTVWDAPYFAGIALYLKYIQQANRRRIVDYFLTQFLLKVENRLPYLRKSTIHGDANNWNVLVQNEQIVGFIDFGDIVYSNLINEIAIAIAYGVTNTNKPMTFATEIVRGYHAVFPLEEAEIELLYYLIAVRLCTTVCMAAYHINLQPENEYITISVKPAWDLLEKWIQIDAKVAENAFREAAGYPLRV